MQQVDVVLNKTGTLNATLTPGATSETIEVSGVAATIDTTSAQIQTNYDARFSQDLGITSAGGTGAGVLNLSLLSPGVTQSSSLGIGVGPSVGGQRPYNNNFTVEGVDNNNKAVTGNLITVPNDAVENFSLLANQFDTEFGHSSGGQFNTTIRSGTNAFHGSLYEYFRNRNLNAVDNAFVLQGLTSNPRFDSNRYGATFGGPIIKNKLFFFTNFERQGISLTATAGGQVLTPTADGLAAIAADPNLSATNFGVFKQYVPVAASCERLSPVLDGSGERLMRRWLSPDRCGFGRKSRISELRELCPECRLQHLFPRSTARPLHLQQAGQSRPGCKPVGVLHHRALPVSPLYPRASITPSRPSVINEFRVGFNRYFNILPDGNFTYPGLDAFPNLILLDLGGNGLQIGPDSQAPQFTIQNLYQGVDNVSWTKGAHTLKFGGEYRWYISPQSFTQRQRGDYDYNSTQLFLEDFSPDNFGERSAGSITYYGNQKAVYWYANDNWKVNNHLTLNLGIRYEYTTVSTSEAQQTLNTISNTPEHHRAGLGEPAPVVQRAAGSQEQLGSSRWIRLSRREAMAPPRFAAASAWPTTCFTTTSGSWRCLRRSAPPMTFDLTTPTPGFLAGGGLPGGGIGHSGSRRGHGTRSHLELDSAGREVAVFHQLEFRGAAFLRQGLHRRGSLCRNPRRPSGCSKQNQPQVAGFPASLLADFPAATFAG